MSSPTNPLNNPFFLVRNFHCKKLISPQIRGIELFFRLGMSCFPEAWRRNKFFMVKNLKPRAPSLKLSNWSPFKLTRWGCRPRFVEEIGRWIQIARKKSMIKKDFFLFGMTFFCRCDLLVLGRVDIQSFSLRRCFISNFWYVFQHLQRGPKRFRYRVSIHHPLGYIYSPTWTLLPQPYPQGCV